MILNADKVAERPPIGKELITRLIVRSYRNLSMFNFKYYSF